MVLHNGHISAVLARSRARRGNGGIPLRCCGNALLPGVIQRAGLSQRAEREISAWFSALLMFWGYQQRNLFWVLLLLLRYAATTRTTTPSHCRRHPAATASEGLLCGREGLKRDRNAVLCRPFSRPDHHGRGGGLEVAVPLIVAWWRVAYAHARMAYDNEREN